MDQSITHVWNLIDEQSPVTNRQLLDITRAVVDVFSESRFEKELVDEIEVLLSGCHWLTVIRIGDNLVARTEFGYEQRVVFAGHTDTVPVNNNFPSVIDVSDESNARLFGVGTADMKSGLAVMLLLAKKSRLTKHDITFVFYAREEIEASASGLLEIIDVDSQLVHGDIALLGEPTNESIEAGCQGTLRVRVSFKGKRAHTARPWMGRNAIHRVGELITKISTTSCREPEILGCHFRESLQIVSIEGGTSGNVVPDETILVINHRFAPDRTGVEANEYVFQIVQEFMDEFDEYEIIDCAQGAMPGVDHPLFSELIEEYSLPVYAKLGWTDVARFAQLDIPAVNFGPGNSLLAHTQGEYVDESNLRKVWDILEKFMLEIRNDSSLDN